MRMQDMNICDVPIIIDMRITLLSVLICFALTACASTATHTDSKPTREEARKELLRRMSVGCKESEDREYWRGFCAAMVKTIRNHESSFNVCIPEPYKQMSDKELSFLLGAYLENSSSIEYMSSEQPFIDGMQNLFPCQRIKSTNKDNAS